MTTSEASTAFGGLHVADDRGFARNAQADVYSAPVYTPPSEARQVTTTERRLTFRQALEETPGYTFRLKPDRRRRPQPYLGSERRHTGTKP